MDGRHKVKALTPIPNSTAILYVAHKLRRGLGRVEDDSRNSGNRMERAHFYMSPG